MYDKILKKNIFNSSDTNSSSTNDQDGRGKTLEGIVTSDSMDKTVVVEIQRFVKHPKYKKFFKKSKKIHAHDEKNMAKVGDKVTIRSIRPRSKKKRFEIVNGGGDNRDKQ